ncbi:hypothetical protein BDF20DRAFT_904064 [Mycotypha africana]|uniref:uncharacterized protein n=1 Tax=Mycotypha africana TaxID=64632 RepID=UPI002300C3B7|nr:uncharacterized protein BDF20DRAFT_904064 [Mycotypha africana]KAI8991376.1 hypothetical protein BDF20DRAFT_904064 [Mycotypha africana]
MSGKGLEKTLQKLRASVNDGKYYEAQQMYRTVARRYNKQGNFADTIRLLHDGSVLLFQHKQYGSASDLANYMLDTYKLAHTPVDETSLDRIVELLNLFPTADNSRKAFISNAFKWSKNEGNFPEGDPELHDFVGTMLFNEKKFNLAEDHLLLGNNHSAEVIGKLAYQWAEDEKVQWKGVYLARVVFQYLANKDIHHASLAFQNFVKTAGFQTIVAESKVRRAPADSEASSVPVFSDPWMNFTQLLLLTVQRDGKDLFTELKSRYKPLYGNETNFVELIDDIGLAFFNIPKPRKQGNMLQEMMASLFSGGAPGAGGNPLLGLGGGNATSGAELD